MYEEWESHARRRAQHARGVEWYRYLGPSERAAVMDALVGGNFDWLDWAERFAWSRPPSRAFLNGVDYAARFLEPGWRDGA